MRVATVEQMRELDRGAVEKYGIQDLLLMENAGLAVYEAVRSRYDIRGMKIVLLCGGGNNGGDGFVIARKLYSNGARVEVLLFSDPAKSKGSAAVNLDICGKIGIPVIVLSGENEDFFIEGRLAAADLIVDALFGTGLTRSVEGLFLKAVEAVNGAGSSVVSVDIPSGVNGNTGKVMGAAVHADLTVTFGLPKPGNIFHPGFTLCGELLVTHISFPPEHYNDDHITMELNAPSPLPQRDPEGHKGSFGKVLFIAGACHYYGAPLLCSRSFLKSGGGYARLAAPEPVIRVIAGSAPEVVYLPQPGSIGGTIASGAAAGLLEAADQNDCTVIGPGLGMDPDTADLVLRCVREIGTLLVIDADGLGAIAGKEKLVSNRKAVTILTPHPGEMARLLDLPAGDIVSRPVEAVREAASRYNSYVVLKGPRSCISGPEGRVWINMTGNSGMGTAGSGDVLSGVIPACFCLGLPPVEALRAAVFIHGLAGDTAAERKGADGITAQDIMEALPEAVQRYRNDKPEKFLPVRVV